MQFCSSESTQPKACCSKLDCRHQQMHQSCSGLVYCTSSNAASAQVVLPPSINNVGYISKELLVLGQVDQIRNISKKAVVASIFNYNFMLFREAFTSISISQSRNIREERSTLGQIKKIKSIEQIVSTYIRQRSEITRCNCMQ